MDPNKGTMLLNKLHEMHSMLIDIQGADTATRKNTQELLETQGIPEIVIYLSSVNAFDSIDEIHEDRAKRREKGIKGLEEDIKYWTTTLRRGRPVSPPKHLECLIDLASLDEENKHEKWKQIESEENFMTSKRRFHQVEQLSERYKIVLPDPKNKEMTDQQILR